MEWFYKFGAFFSSNPEWMAVIIVIGLFLYYGEKRERRGEERDSAMLTIIKENTAAFGRMEKAMERWEPE